MCPHYSNAGKRGELAQRRVCQVSFLTAGFGAAACIPRHPVQLYELAAATLCLVAITLVERRGRDTAGSGVSTGIFLTGYFSLRIVIEFFKQVGVEQLREAGGPLETLNRMTGLTLNTAQWLSVVPVAIGSILLIRAARRNRPVLIAPAVAPRPVT